MPANIAQEVDVVQLVKPVGIVAHHGIAAGVFEFKKFRKDCADAFEVSADRLIGQNAPRFVLARGIADARRATAHQRNRAMSRPLQPLQHHNWQE